MRVRTLIHLSVTLGGFLSACTAQVDMTDTRERALGKADGEAVSSLFESITVDADPEISAPIAVRVRLPGDSQVDCRDVYGSLQATAGERTSMLFQTDGTSSKSCITARISVEITATLTDPATGRIWERIHRVGPGYQTPLEGRMEPSAPFGREIALFDVWDAPRYELYADAPAADAPEELIATVTSNLARHEPDDSVPPHYHPTTTLASEPMNKVVVDPSEANDLPGPLAQYSLEFPFSIEMSLFLTRGLDGGDASGVVETYRFLPGALERVFDAGQVDFDHGL